MKLHLSADAERDLAEIYRYMAQYNVAIAKRVVGRLYDQMKYILRFPQAAPLRSHIRKNLHALPVDNYVIYYVPEAKEIKIVRILHGAQDMQDKF